MVWCLSLLSSNVLFALAMNPRWIAECFMSFAKMSTIFASNPAGPLPAQDVSEVEQTYMKYRENYNSGLNSLSTGCSWLQLLLSMVLVRPKVWPCGHLSSGACYFKFAPKCTCWNTWSWSYFGDIFVKVFVFPIVALHTVPPAKDLWLYPSGWQPSLLSVPVGWGSDTSGVLAYSCPPLTSFEIISHIKKCVSWGQSSFPLNRYDLLLFLDTGDRSMNLDI